MAVSFFVIQRQAAMEPQTQSNLDTAQAASAAQFDRQSARYGKSHILADTSDVAEALSGLAPSSGGRALDVATGGGHTALRLARMGWTVTAGDVSARMLEGAAKLLRDQGLAMETMLFPAENIPFDDATFDLVTVRVAPHHFSSPAAFVAEASRVLRPGGHFLLIDGTVPDGDDATEEWLHRVEKWRDPSHGRFLSRASWEAARHGIRTSRSCRARSTRKSSLTSTGISRPRLRRQRTGSSSSMPSMPPPGMSARPWDWPTRMGRSSGGGR